MSCLSNSYNMAVEIYSSKNLYLSQRAKAQGQGYDNIVIQLLYPTFNCLQHLTAMLLEAYNKSFVLWSIQGSGVQLAIDHLAHTGRAIHHYSTLQP